MYQFIFNWGWNIRFLTLDFKFAIVLFMLHAKNVSSKDLCKDKTLIITIDTSISRYCFSNIAFLRLIWHISLSRIGTKNLFLNRVLWIPVFGVRPRSFKYWQYNLQKMYKSAYCCLRGQYVLLFKGTQSCVPWICNSLVEKLKGTRNSVVCV